MEQITLSPATGKPVVTRKLATKEDAFAQLEKSQQAFLQWRKVPIKERIAVVLRMVDAFVAKKPEIGAELTLMMGRPIKYAQNEVNGFAERAKYMASISESALKDKEVPNDPSKPGFKRFIRRDPLGVVLIIPAWNYPYLTAVNGIVPAILAGNTVVLKHSQQTPLCSERIAEAFKAAGLPDGVFSYLHMDHKTTAEVIKHPLVSFVNFTGSVPGGRQVQQACAVPAGADNHKFIGCGLELGGKDPAYVRPDANMESAVENLVDGSFFNSGQCCCGIERIYVHQQVYDEFVKKFVDLTNQYVLGDPADLKTTLGPMVKVSLADTVREHIDDAIKKGAKALIDESRFPLSKKGTTYLAPQVLVNVNHSMKVMTEETFGPVVGIMSVASDAEAIKLMNDSPYGLTASIWTTNVEEAERIGEQVETGTVFMNRCDYVDPGLAWTGVKATGVGCTLSEYGFLALTRPKSFHLKLA